jgi:hypothetical protein
MPVAAAPSFSPGAGTYTSTQTVTLSTTTPSATFYYTTNGSTPTTSSTPYSGSISVSASETVEAITVATGYTTSSAGSAAYTIETPAATPVFSPGAGSYAGAQTVTISDAVSGATIYYTTNGSAPTTNSPVYSSAVIVSANETLVAMATAYNYIPSATGSATYTIAAGTPTFSPAGGSYNTAQTVTISDVTPGAAIYYTTNGTMPTSGSTFYSAPIIVAGSTTSTTVNAIAVASGYATSAVRSATYTIPTPAALTTPAPGTTLSGTSVTFTWTPGNAATLFQLFVGTTGVGSHDVYNSGPVKVDSEGVGGLPSNGETVYVRLYWLIGSTWRTADYT